MSERKEGWYWVKCHDDDQWQCAEWQYGGWWMVGEEMHIGNSMVVGQRIPTPDEPWQCIPVEPTLPMIAALGWGGDEDLAIGHAAISEYIEEAYADMLSAAPTPE